MGINYRRTDIPITENGSNLLADRSRQQAKVPPILVHSPSVRSVSKKDPLSNPSGRNYYTAGDVKPCLGTVDAAFMDSLGLFYISASTKIS
jgi:hypothetical protein